MDAHEHNEGINIQLGPTRKLDNHSNSRNAEPKVQEGKSLSKTAN